MKNHKSCAGEGKCLCDKCEHRFECFTNEHLFTDPILQGLYEALVADGDTKEEALVEIIETLKSKLDPLPHTISSDKTWNVYCDTTAGSTIVTPVSTAGNTYQYTYTTSTGKDLVFNAAKK